MKTVKIIVLLVLLCALPLLCGCTGSERLKNMTVVQGVSFDTAARGVAVTIQYLDLTKGSGKNENIGSNITATVSAHGSSMREAVAAVGEKLPNTLFFGQNKVIFVSETFEKSHEKELKEYLIKNTDSRPDVCLVKCRGSASKTLKTAQKNTRVPAESVCKQLEKSGRDVTASAYLAGDALPYYP